MSLTSPEIELTPLDVLDMKIAGAKRGWKKTEKKASQKPEQKADETKTAKGRMLTRILLILIVLVGLLILWLGVGVMMNRGVLPSVDLGYSFMQDFLSNVFG